MEEDLAGCRHIFGKTKQKTICFLKKGTNQNPASLVRVTVVSVCTLGICDSVTSAFLNQSWILKGIWILKRILVFWIQNVNVHSCVVFILNYNIFAYH